MLAHPLLAEAPAFQGGLARLYRQGGALWKVGGPEARLDAEARALTRAWAAAPGRVPEPRGLERLPDGQTALRMSELPGAPLADRIGAGMPLVEGLAVVLQVAELLAALLAAPDGPLHHLDLKPENVLIEDTADGPRARLVDFGAALAPEAHTPAWAAPERRGDGGFDPARADVWGLGLLLYVCLSGRFPWNPLAPTARPAPLPAALRAPRALRGLIRRCLALDPARRPADAAAVAELLRRIRPPRHQPRVELRQAGELWALVIDDLLPDPAAARAAALAADWRPHRGRFPGFEAELPLPSPDPSVLVRAATGLDCALDPALHERSRYHLASAHIPAALRAQAPHVDWGRDLACVLYLTPGREDVGGTGLFRHRATGWTSPPEGEDDRLAEVLRDPAPREGEGLALIEGDTEDWALALRLEHRFNRMVIYPALFFHSGLIPDGGFGETPETRRLTQMVFLRLVGERD